MINKIKKLFRNDPELVAGSIIIFVVLVTIVFCFYNINATFEEIRKNRISPSYQQGEIAELILSNVKVQITDSYCNSKTCFYTVVDESNQKYNRVEEFRLKKVDKYE